MAGQPQPATRCGIDVSALRPYIVYGSRKVAAPPEPETGGREWREIGVPYGAAARG